MDVKNCIIKDKGPVAALILKVYIVIQVAYIKAMLVTHIYMIFSALIILLFQINKKNDKLATLYYT